MVPTVSMPSDVSSLCLAGGKPWLVVDGGKGTLCSVEYRNGPATHRHRCFDDDR